jgi:hypothetical protein
MAKNKSNKRSGNKSRKSLKGKWNHIGAPPKSTKWPTRPFTMEQLFERNSKGANGQCELSLRNKVDARIAAGELIELKSKKQPHGAVGRPKAVFVLATKFDASKMEKADKKAKTPKATKKSTVAVTAPTPATAPAPVAPVTATPVASSAAPAPETTPAAPTPEVAAPAPETTVATPAPEVAAPAAPAPQVG